MVKAYKGFNRDMTCRGYQYKEGETYHTDTAELCESGYHACEAPLDCLKYYAPASSIYHEVELDELSDKRSEDSKICGKTIKIGARLDIAGIVQAQIDYVKAHTTEEHTDPKQASAGDGGVASAGRCGVASAGSSGAASAGSSGATTSRGSSAVGANGIASARGNGCRVKGGLGALLIIAEESEYSYDILHWCAVVVDGDAIKADTWYKLVDGELVEDKED